MLNSNMHKSQEEIYYNEERTFAEYRNYIDSNGVPYEKDSKSRFGWTHIPYAVPYGIVVTHAAINIAKWMALLSVKCNL